MLVDAWEMLWKSLDVLGDDWKYLRMVGNDLT